MPIKPWCMKCGKRATDDARRKLFELREYSVKRPRYVEYIIKLCPECSREMEEGPKSMAAFATYWTERKNKAGA